MSATPANVSYEQAGELKIGQVGVANLRVRTLDVAKLTHEMRERVQRAPKLFGRAAVIIDFGGLAQTPDAATAQALLDGLLDAGVIPVALAYGTRETEQLAGQLGLPLLSKFRAQYEPVGGAAPEASVGASSAPAVRRDSVAADPVPAQAKTAEPVSSGKPGLVQKLPVRSGQQLYAENRDLTVLSTVGAGAEVIADGSIHIYGTLRGRALAGAQGNPDARIFCREFHAELVAIAGNYKVLDDVPKELHGKAVQVWLQRGADQQDQLMIAAQD